MGKRASSIELSDEEREYLELQTRARTIQAQTVTRARILLLRAQNSRFLWISHYQTTHFEPYY